MVLFACGQERAYKKYYQMIEHDSFPLKSKSNVRGATIDVKYCPVLFNVLNECRSFSKESDFYDSLYTLYAKDLVFQIKVDSVQNVIMLEDSINAPTNVLAIEHYFSEKLYLVIENDTLTNPSVHRIADGRNEVNLHVIFGNVKTDSGFGVYLKDIFKSDVQSLSALELMSADSEELLKYNHL